MPEATRRMIRLAQGNLYGILSQLMTKKPQFEIDFRVEGVSQDAILQDEEMGSCAKSIGNGLSKGKMIFSEESSRAIYEKSNMELIELRQTSATIQCPSCLKHAPEGLNMCQCGFWLRPNQSTMERIRAAFAALKTPFFRTTAILSRGRKSELHPWQTDHAKAMDARRGAPKNSRKLHGWTEEYVKYLDYISQIDINYEAPYKQRSRCENTLFMRGVRFQ